MELHRKDQDNQEDICFSIVLSDILVCTKVGVMIVTEVHLNSELLVQIVFLLEATLLPLQGSRPYGNDIEITCTLVHYL